jgi:hypothetical protein
MDPSPSKESVQHDEATASSLPTPSQSEHNEATAAGLAAAEAALQDPVGAETRKSRLYLLGLSLVSIAIVHTGLVPQEISTLGIQFGEANRKSLLIILALLVLYYLTAFLLYGVSEFLAWRTLWARAIWDQRRITGDTDSALRVMDPNVPRRFFLAKGVSASRALFEFLLPPLVGIYAVGILIFAVATW